MLKIYDNGTDIVSIGTVKEIKPGTGKVEGKVVTVVFHQKYWDAAQKKTVEEDVEIPFWNSDKNTKCAFADFFNRMSACEGSEIMFSCSEYNGKLSGKIATYSNEWHFSDPAGKDTNIVFGIVRKVSSHGDGDKKFFSVSIPLTQRDQSTDWKNISFGNKGKLADRAEKCLKNGTKCAIVTSGPVVSDSGYVNYYGSNFYIF